MSPKPTTQTHPADPVWREETRGYRRWERSTTLGTGPDVWEWAATEVMRWGVKTRSGFSVSPSTTVSAGMQPVITAHPLGVSIREPVEVVDVVRTADRIGFAYRTLPGHPVSGEEAFIVCRDGEQVVLIIRSLTRPADSLAWWLSYPILLLAQKVARHRYMRALRPKAAP